MNSSWIGRLRERNVPQILGAYLAAGWLVLQLCDQLVGNGILKDSFYKTTLVTYLLGIPAIGLLAWFHGKRGRQSFSRLEVMLLVSIVVIWFVAAGIVVYSGPRHVARGAPIKPAVAEAAERTGGNFVILPFRNLSGSAEYDWLIDGSPSLLGDVLSQWREITVVPPERLHSVLRQHRQTAGQAVDIEVLLKIARETGARTVVAGDVVKTGDQLLIIARAYEAVSGALVIDARQTLQRDQDVRDAYEDLAARLLRAAGVENVDVDLRSVTTESLEAYKAYADGVGHWHRGEVRQAQRAFETAVQLDTTFAQAWARLAVVSTRTVDDLLDSRSRAYVYLERAADLAARLPEAQRRYIEALRSFFHGQFGVARSQTEAIIARDTVNVDAMELLIDIEVTDAILVKSKGNERPRGSYNRAVRLGERVLSLDPQRHSVYRLLTTLYTRLADPLTGRSMPPAVIVAGYEKEAESLPALFKSFPTKSFRAILRDSIELIPTAMAAQLSGQTLDESKARALDKARMWINRWLAVAPAEATAHIAASRLAALEHDVTAAVAAQHAAESLSAGKDQAEVPIHRITLLAGQRRYTEARSLADSLAHTGFFDHIPLANVSPDYGWAFAIYLLHADTMINVIVRAFSKAIEPILPSMIAQGFFKEPKTPEDRTKVVEEVVTALMCSSKEGDMKQGHIASPAAAPPAILFEALDSIINKVDRIDANSFIARQLPAVLWHAAYSSDPDAAQRGAARAIDLAERLSANAGTRDVAQRLADVAVGVNPSLRSRIAPRN